jgi:hypothetical protein
MADYWELYNTAKVFFNKTRRFYCLALRANVYFDQGGLRHILRKKGLKRPIPDQIRRLKLLSRIEKILADPGLIIEERGGFHRLSLTTTEQVVRIVLVKMMDGDFRYISIMEHRTRKAP